MRSIAKKYVHLLFQNPKVNKIKLVKIGNIELGENPLILAPMEDVTDSPFRMICKEFGADLMYTEFISSEGLIRDASKSTRKLDFEEVERPLGIQIFGHQLDSMIAAAKVSETEKPDLIDINYGCPVKKVVFRGAGAAFLKDIPRMVAMTKAVIDAVNLPVTIKTRIGWDENSINILEVALRMQKIGVKAISIHGRTRSQQYTGEANWEEIGKVKQHPEIEIPVFGNGDITTPEIAVERLKTYGVDGIMIGRGAMGNPWIFEQTKALLRGEEYHVPSLVERVELCKKQFESSEMLKGTDVTVREMRKYYNNYFKGIPHFKPWKLKLLTIPTKSEVFDVLDMLPHVLGIDDINY